MTHLDLDVRRTLVVRSPLDYQTEPLPGPYFWRYWTPVVGPTAVLLAATVVDREGEDWTLADLGRLVGTSRRAIIAGSFLRLMRNHLLWLDSAGSTVTVPARVPRLTGAKLGELPPGLAVEEAGWMS